MADKEKMSTYSVKEKFKQRARTGKKIEKLKSEGMSYVDIREKLELGLYEFKACRQAYRMNKSY